jgi:hypothetical protein
VEIALSIQKLGFLALKPWPVLLLALLRRSTLVTDTRTMVRNRQQVTGHTSAMLSSRFLIRSVLPFSTSLERSFLFAQTRPAKEVGGHSGQACKHEPSLRALPLLLLIPLDGILQ